MTLKKIDSTTTNLHYNVAISLEKLSQSTFTYLNMPNNMRYTNTIFFAETIESRSFVDVIIILLLHQQQYNQIISNEIDTYIEKAINFANNSFNEIGNDNVIELYNDFIELYNKETPIPKAVAVKRLF